MVCSQECLSVTKQQKRKFIFVNEPLQNLSSSRKVCSNDYNGTLASLLTREDYENLNRCCKNEPSHPYRIGLVSNVNLCENQTAGDFFWADITPRLCDTGIPLMPGEAPNRQCHTVQLTFGSTVENTLNSSQWLWCRNKTRFICQKTTNEQLTNPAVLDTAVIAASAASSSVILLLILFLIFCRSKMYEEMKFKLNSRLLHKSKDNGNSEFQNPYNNDDETPQPQMQDSSTAEINFANTKKNDTKMGNYGHNNDSDFPVYSEICHGSAQLHTKELKENELYDSQQFAAATNMTHHVEEANPYNSLDRSGVAAIKTECYHTLSFNSKLTSEPSDPDNNYSALSANQHSDNNTAVYDVIER